MTVISKSKILSIGYEILMALLALGAVATSFLDFTGRIVLKPPSLLYYCDLIILLIFAVDYIIRLINSEDKKRFFIHNLFDLLAIIPFNSMFRAFRFARFMRFARLFRLLRVLSIIILLKRFVSRADIFLKTNGFIYVLYLTLMTMLLGSFGIYHFEQGKTVETFGDALWWSFVTATTVGYGDISPVTVTGRLIAAVLMLVGIGFIGMLTGTIATFFLKDKKSDNREIIEHLSLDLSDLSSEEYNEVSRFVEFIRSKRE